MQNQCNEALVHKAPPLNSDDLDNLPINRNSRDEVSALRDENFNLKLRLYLMEQRLASPFRSSINKESLSRKLDEANRMIAELQQSIDEKLDILKDINIAMMDHKDMHKRYVIETGARIADLEDCVRNLQSKLEENIFEGDPLPKNKCLMPNSNSLDSSLECVNSVFVCALSSMSIRSSEDI